MRRDAGSVHLYPRADKQHGCAGGAEDVGDDGADEQENDVRQRSGFAFGADVNAAGHDEQRADQRDETDVFMGRLCEAVCVVQGQQIIARRDRAEAERYFGVMPQPPAWRKDRRGRHRAE